MSFLPVGSGFGMMHLVAIVCVQHWFDKWRCRALAFIFCGVGVGTFAWPPMSAFFYHTFSLGGTLLLLAGLQMQGLWCSILLRSYRGSTDQDLLASDEDDTVDNNTARSEYQLVKTPNYFTARYSGQLEDQVAELRDTDLHVHRRSRRPKRTRPLSTGFLESYQRDSPRLDRSRSRIARLGTQELLNQLAVPDALNTFTSAKNVHTPRTFTSQMEPYVPPVRGEEVETTPLPPSRRGPLDSSSIFVDFIEDNQLHGPSDATIQKSKVKRYTWSAFDSNFDAMDYKDHYDVIEEGSDNRGWSGVVYQLQPSAPSTTDSSLSLSIITNSGISVFKDIPYVIFILGSLVESMGFFTPLHYLPMRAVSVGHEHHEVVLILSVFGIFSLLSRTVAGIVGDRYPSGRCWICCASLTIAGILTAFTSFADHYVTLVIYASGLGVGAGRFISLEYSQRHIIQVRSYFIHHRHYSLWPNAELIIYII